MISARTWLTSLTFLALASAPAAFAQDDSNTKADHEVDGKWFTAEDIPTFKVAEDGTVDWYTFSGFRRYHAECHVCHGPDGQGSSYAPAIAKSAVNMDYYDFVDVVVNGRQNGNSVMPSFGTNLNVMCYLDDIYVYLKAVGSEAIPRGRPAKRADKPAAYAEAENACMGS
jgi:methanol metabolism-related c-type cytochrome